MIRHHSSIAVHCMLLLGIVSLHFVSAKTLSAGSQCGSTVIGTCEDGLACVPETPGSVFNVCRDSGNSTCETERCPSLSCDSNLQYTPEGECCPLCLPLPTAVFVISLGCMDENVHYNEGDIWRRSACITCTCEEGLPHCSSEQCLAPECDNPVTIPDQCCPTCLVEPSVVYVPENITCQYKGETYSNGDRWNKSGDPCVTCFCDDGEVLCTSQNCSVECENSIQLPDTCCPICPEVSTETSTQQPVPLATSLPPPPPPVVIISPPVLSQCEHDGQTYEDGTSWNPNGDPCTNCSCSQGLTLCFAKSCSAECMEPVHLPGICCPFCPGDEGYPTSMSTTIPPSHTSHPTPSSSHPPSTTTHSPSPSPHPDDVTPPTTISTTTPHSPSGKSTPCKDTSCTMETVTISVVLELDYSQYLKEEELVTTQLKDALKELGLEVATIKSAEFGHKQTHVVISVYSSEDKTSGEEELKTTLGQLQFPLVSSVKIGQHEESKSITEVSNTNAQQSTQKNSQGPGKTTIIIAVTATIATAVFSAIIIAVVITRTWRKLNLSKTVTV